MSDRPGTAGPQVAQLSDFHSEVARWRAELDQAKREFTDWWRECDRIERIYRGQKPRGVNKPTAFAILWSNVETLKPAIYARPPVPVVARTFSDADPVGRAASMILRRCIQQEIEANKVDRKIKQVRDDYLLYGRGVLWACYVAAGDKKDVQISEDGRTSFGVVKNEAVEWDFVRRADFLHAPAPSWDFMPWVARRVRMTQEDGVKRFGRKFYNVPLDYEPTDPRQRMGESDIDVLSRAVVYEIWDERKREVLWIAEGYDKVLDKIDDPLHLRDFFPTPRPLYATLTDSSLVPVPDYVEYEEQAVQLDILTRRIRMLTAAIKATGTYDAQYPEIKRMFNENSENELIPIKTWREFAEKGGLNSAIEVLEVLPLAQTLETLIAARAQVKSDLYEITGISDVIRGAETVSGDKTATEIKTKGKYATLRLSDRQAQMAEYVRDILRITGEIIAEHFDPRTLAEASNWQASELAQDDARNVQAAMAQGQMVQPMFPQAVGLLRNDRLRGFRIDVEDKSTIAVDEAEEKAARVQFLEAVGGFINQAVSIPPELAPILAPMMGKMLMFGVRGFPVGLELETSLEDTIAKLQKHLEKQAQQPPKPDPDMIKAQAEAKRADADVQIKQMESQAKMQGDQQKNAAMMRKAEIDLMIAQATLETKRIDAQMAGVKLQADAAQAEAQNSQDLVDHQLALQDADLAQNEFAHQTQIDWAKIAIEQEKVGVAREAAKQRATAE